MKPIKLVFSVISNKSLSGDIRYVHPTYYALIWNKNKLALIQYLKRTLLRVWVCTVKLGIKELFSHHKIVH